MTSSWRLTLARQGDSFAVQSVERIPGRTAGGEWLDPERHRAAARGAPAFGRFVELRDAGGRMIYRRAITQTLPDTLEYPTGNADRPFGRIPMPEGRLLFLRVPADDRAASLAVTETALPPPAARRRAGPPVAAPETRTLLTVDLTSGREDK